MRIRRYTGKDAQEAMLKVKMDLGSEAIILSTRKVRRKGITGLFCKPLTEVLAATDEEYGRTKETPAPSSRPIMETVTYNRHGEKKSPAGDNRMESLENRVNQMESMLERIFESVEKKSNTEAKPAPAENGNLSEDLPVFGKKKAAEAAGDRSSEPSGGKNGDTGKEKSDAYELLRKVLSDNEVESSIIEKLIGKLRQFVKNQDSYEEISGIAEKILQKILGQPQGIQFRQDGKPTTVMFIGPTGVGKTTTLAKLAADYTLNHPKKVALITADTYRIAAVEQLKTYAEILNIPVSVIYSPQEIKTAIEQHQDKDLILIDTAGRSHKNPAQLTELKQLVAAAEADEVFLVLNCAMNRLACREILTQYSFMKKFKLLFTKLDEALVPGVILNARYATGKPLSYTTAGQSVPDDIEIANVEEIVRNVLQIREND